jgi:hypothetical protein
MSKWIPWISVSYGGFFFLDLKGFQCVSRLLPIEEPACYTSLARI